MDVELTEFYNKMLTQDILQVDYEQANTYLQLLNLNNEEFAPYTIQVLKDKLLTVKKLYDDKYVLIDKIEKLRQLSYKSCSRKAALECFQLDQYFNYECDQFNVSIYYKQWILRALTDINLIYDVYSRSDKHFDKFKQLFDETRHMLIKSRIFLQSIDTSIYNDYKKELRYYMKYFHNLMSYAVILSLPTLHDEIEKTYNHLLRCQESLKHGSNSFIKI